MTVLDVGCGWGAFGKFAAEHYGATTVGVTVSREQVELGRELCRGLPVTFLLQDYRTVRGQFDRVISLGMFEHVGAKNYRTFMQTVRDALKPDGLLLLHTIGSPVTVRAADPWIGRYIFPDSLIPSAAQIASAFDGLFVLEDWHSFGPDYVKTLSAWFENFDRQWRGPRDDAFYRMWKYYLLSAAGGFKARRRQIWQLLLSKGGVPDAGPRES
jgi:cyclopropane-fatty-acyl-phospholipid synthase